MDKAQAIHEFWSSFGLTAYDETILPDSAQMPYITYSISTGDIDDTQVLNASIWYRSTSWKEITEKEKEIAEYIAKNGHVVLKLDNGYLWLVKANTFSQRMSDPDDSMVRRMYLMINAEFLTGY